LLRSAEAAGVDDFYRSGYHQLLAQCLLREEQIAEAIAEYHKAFAAQRRMPNVRLGLQIDFAWQVAVGRLTECYADALAYLGEFTDTMDLAWPANQYRYFGALAMISEALGDFAGARRWATNALEAASRSESQFPGHPELGLVTRPESGVYNELLRLAAA
jgi:tetratricopeptide (TPR) repeat protein